MVLFSLLFWPRNSFNVWRNNEFYNSNIIDYHLQYFAFATIYKSKTKITTSNSMASMSKNGYSNTFNIEFVSNILFTFINSCCSASLWSPTWDRRWCSTLCFLSRLFYWFTFTVCLSRFITRSLEKSESTSRNIDKTSTTTTEGCSTVFLMIKCAI